MATARDNLVADWRRELHAAESALASSLSAWKSSPEAPSRDGRRRS
jgi:hypothetical protein